jgi:hypothetical protein
MRTVMARGTVFGLLALSALALPYRLQAQLPSSPRRFVDFLDTRCYEIPNQGPLNVPLVLTHLNPVLLGMGLPVEDINLQAPEKLCVPVTKNGSTAPSDTLPFIQYVDWACYGITGPSVNTPLTLTHLNTVFAGLFGPTVAVTMLEPQQLCVPVIKNSSNPPLNVQQLVEWLDVKCYGVSSSQNQTHPITLAHLNPLLAGLKPEVSTVGPAPNQLCVPVSKNNQQAPSNIQPYINFADVLCYPATGASLNMTLTLEHMNPVLVGMGLPTETVPITLSQQLCVPVAKNGTFPPGPP